MRVLASALLTVGSAARRTTGTGRAKNLLPLRFLNVPAADLRVPAGQILVTIEHQASLWRADEFRHLMRTEVGRDRRRNGVPL